MRKTTQVNISVDVELPTLPTGFMQPDETWIDVKNLSDESITEIARAWRDALVELAQQRRNAAKKEGAK